jgi:two-component system alkaline phosphatase synthesis response regulator PhoP
MSTVLIVDDDASIRALIGYVLDEQGHEVREASDGEEALRELLVDAPDCMVLDLMMPHIDGVEVLRRRQQQSLAARTRVLVLTAKSDPKDAVWCWELGADEFLVKPVEPERLAREVRQLLARTPAELQLRRKVGLADARELDRLEQAFTPQDPE